MIDPSPVVVSLVPPPAPPPPPPAPAKRPEPARTAPSPKKPARAPRVARARAAAPRREVRPAPEPDSLPAAEVQTVELSDAQLAGAITAGSGDGGGAGVGGGRTCDMVRRLQNALRHDWRVQAAIADALRTPGSGRGAIMLWDGDWIRSAGQDGKGLASVRQAIVADVAFAPQACRSEPMRGLVLLSLSDRPGSARIVLGSGLWRWSDLLFAR